MTSSAHAQWRLGHFPLCTFFVEWNLPYQVVFWIPVLDSLSLEFEKARIIHHGKYMVLLYMHNHIQVLYMAIACFTVLNLDLANSPCKISHGPHVKSVYLYMWYQMQCVNCSIFLFLVCSKCAAC